MGYVSNLKKRFTYLASCIGVPGVLILLLVLTPAAFAQSPKAQAVQYKPITAQLPNAVVQTRAKEVLTKIPLSFELNQGQTNEEVRFFSRGAGHTLWLTADEAVLAQRGVRKSAKGKLASDNSNSQEFEVFHLKLANANRHAPVEGLEELPRKTNYFIGNDPKKWRTNVPSYAKVRYHGIYPGVDLVYYGNEAGQPEYDFVVAPGADPQQIVLDVQPGLGVPESTPRESARLTANGDLILHGANTDLRFQKPVIYQQNTDGARVYVAGNYVLTTSPKSEHRASKISFTLTDYDHTKQLIIDPAITYMSYVGGGADIVTSVAVGQNSGSNKNFLYVAGFTDSPLLPVTSNAQQPSMLGTRDDFIAKIDPSHSGNSSLVYCSYFGGGIIDPQRGDQVSAIAADQSGNVYLTGSVSSDSFPQVQPLVTGLGSVSSAFLTKLNSDGSNITFSTRFGGTQGPSPQTFARAIAVDNTGNVYIAGDTGALITLANPYLTSRGNGFAGFVTGFATNGTPSITYSTYIGQSPVGLNNFDSATRAIAIGPSGSLYVAGVTLTIPNLGGFQNTGGGFFLVLQPNGFVGQNQLRYSTNLGGNVSALAVDASGNAYITGSAVPPSLPTTLGAFRSGASGPGGAFVLKVNPAAVADASLVFSTFLNNDPSWPYSLPESASGIVVDSNGDTYVAGTTYSNTFPVVNPAQASMYGVSQSVDAGKTWVALSRGLTPPIVFALTVDTSSSPHNLYAATSGFNTPNPGNTPPPVTLYRSSDGGLNWQPANNGMQGLWTMETAVDPANNSNIYAASSAGVYRSTDQGSNWTLFNPGNTDLAGQFVTALAFDGPTLYAGTLNGLYALTNGSWARSGLSTSIDHIAVDPNTSPHTLYASCSAQYGGPCPQLLKSSDVERTTWALLSGPSDPHLISYVVLNSVTKPTTIYGLNNSAPTPILWKSADGGANWSHFSDLNGLNGALLQNQIAIDMTTTPASFYASDISNGLYRSTNDGTTWNLILNGPTGPIAIDSTNASQTTPSTIYAANFGGFGEGFLAELDPTGSNLLFSTQIGGIHGLNPYGASGQISSLARDSNGTLYVGGFSDSSFLPTINAFEPISPRTDPFNYVRTGFVAAIGDAQLAVPQGCTTCSASTQVNVPNGTLSVSLPNVSGSSTGGTATVSVTPLSASDTANFSLSNNLGAYDISTTATFSASPSNPIALCFQAQTVNDPITFNGLRLIHIVNGNPVDSTSSHDFATRTVCGFVTSLSPFILINGTPTVTWGSPQSITYGTPLSSTQLNATASVPGTFSYSPAAGTVIGPGQQTLSATFTPANPALYSSVTRTTNINVLYSMASCNGDLGHTVLQPINTDGTSVFKLGSTVPTKFRVCDANGSSVGIPGTVTSYQLVAAGAATGLTVDEQVYSTAADTTFRWDPIGKQWIFNQATGKNNATLSQANTVYRFRITLKDGSTIPFQYGLK
jgi:Beta-propeller repeat